MTECPKCGDGSNGFTYYVQDCTMEYMGFFGDADSDQLVDIAHRRQRPKTVVCNNCNRRMARSAAVGAK